MHYQQHFDDSRSIGKILFCLETMGIPFNYLVNITQEPANPNILYYKSSIFSYITWDGNIPIFDVIYPEYRKLLQKPFYKLYECLHGTVFVELLEFNSKDVLDKYIKDNKIENYVIKDILGRCVNNQLYTLDINETTIEDKAKLLSARFNKR